MKTYTITKYNAEIQLTPEDMANGFIVKLDLPYEFYDSGKLKLRFCNGHIADDAPRSERGVPTILGHPNCEVGACDYDCHVVSCAIHQGFSEEPYFCPQDSEDS